MLNKQRLYLIFLQTAGQINVNSIIYIYNVHNTVHAIYYFNLL